MALIFFPLGPAKSRDIVNLVNARHQSLRRWFGEPNLPGKLTPLEIGSSNIVMQTLSALGAGGGTRTPTTFVTGT
jgi:hypothetical protein